MSKKSFLIINGPNLNLLGRRENDVYGNKTLEQIKSYTEKKVECLDISVDWFQSNLEGEIVSRINQVQVQGYDALIINPGAYGHTSVAILDAMRSLGTPIIEVHLTNTLRRESYRQVKLTAKSATIIMEGLGTDAYWMAIFSQAYR